MTTTIFDRDGYHDQGALSCLGTTPLLVVRAIIGPGGAGLPRANRGRIAPLSGAAG
jgi:hypothetical protein